MAAKINFALLGNRDNQPPSFEAFLELTRKLTGREPTDEERAAAKREYDDWMTELGMAAPND